MMGYRGTQQDAARLAILSKAIEVLASTRPGDGVSLTDNEVDGARFSVNLIPHTLAATTMKSLAEGDRVHLEIDLIARYVARLHEPAR